jgi:hypothetical protein
MAAETAAAAAATAAKRKEEYKKDIARRLTQRREILQRLDRAEDLTLELLRIAGQTTDALQNLSMTSSSSATDSAYGALDLAKLSETFRATLKELHPLLTQDRTEQLIRPYYPNHHHQQQQQQKLQLQTKGNDKNKDEIEDEEEQQQHEHRMSVYTSRAEMRLAKDRADVLRAFVELEKQEQQHIQSEFKTQNDIGDANAAIAGRLKRKQSGE